MGISIVLLQLLTSALDMSAEEVSRQLVVFKLKAVQDKRLFHMQQEVATFEAIEDFKVMDLGYVENTESGWCMGQWNGQRMIVRCTGGHIVTGLLGLVITRFRWWCRWALFCQVVWGKGTKRQNFYAVRFIQLFLLVTGLTAELRGAIESASIQQFYQKDSPSSGKTGGIHCKIMSTCFSLQFKPPESCHC